MTITEKGYCHIPSTGAVDAAHIGLAADVAAMTAHVRRRQAIAPRTAPGLLLMALHRRRDAALSSRRPRPINLVSCDNIPSNGAILSAVMAEVAAEVDPSLALWIADNAAFPSTMVDRIVPATTSADLDEAAKTLGLSDLAAVGGEPFRQWVIEDSFTARRPRWEAAGAEFVADVQPHEYVKMRVLNAAQTILALTGALAGHTYTFEAVADPILRDFAFRTLREETLPHLPRVAGMDARHYLDQSFARIANTAIRHRCHQVATDTSQKIRQRLLDPLRGNRSTGRVSPGLERAVAAWIAWLARSAPPFGARWPMDDPAAPRLSRVLGRRGRDVSGIVKDVLAHKDIFGPDLGQDDDLSGRVAGFVAEFLSGPSAAAQQSRTATAD
jgi:fructuronate reductase